MDNELEQAVVRGLREQAMVRGLREGKAEAWRALYDAYAEPVWRLVARWLGPESADVADVVQETFMAAARSAPTYDPARGSLWFWLTGIARRHVALHFRKQQRHDRVRCTTISATFSPGSEYQGGPSQLLESAELATLVRATLTELPEDYENLLTAKYLDGDSVKAIASKECSTETAVRSKLARARQAFREAFGKHGVAVTEQ